MEVELYGKMRDSAKLQGVSFHFPQNIFTSRLSLGMVSEYLKFMDKKNKKSPRGQLFTKPKKSYTSVFFLKESKRAPRKDPTITDSDINARQVLQLNNSQYLRRFSC